MAYPCLVAAAHEGGRGAVLANTGPSPAPLPLGTRQGVNSGLPDVQQQPAATRASLSRPPISQGRAPTERQHSRASSSQQPNLERGVELVRPVPAFI